MAQGQKTDVRVEIPAGVYRQAAPLMLQWGRIPTQGTLTLEGPEQGDAVISGARSILHFSKLASAPGLQRIPRAAQPHVLEADLTALGYASAPAPIVRGFGVPMQPERDELFFRGAPVPRAGWPNDGYARVRSADAGVPARGFSIAGRSVDAWRDEPELIAIGFFGRDWAQETIPVAELVANQDRLLLQAPGARFGILAEQRVRIDNALSELDAPGEWYIDNHTAKLYFWPPQPIADGDVQLSMRDSLLQIDQSSRVHVRRLAFEMARGDAVLVRNCIDTDIEDSAVRDIGNRAIVFLGGHNDGLRRMDIHDIGGGGVILQGGSRATLAPGNLFVEDSRIQRFSRFQRTYQPAVSVNGVGNRVVGTVISDGPHSAIIFGGNDHVIAYNNISHVVEASGDAGAIYGGRDWTFRGTVIAHNFFHDIRSPLSASASMGVYLDDQLSGTSIVGNIFARVMQPIFIGGGRDNLVEDNLLLDSPPGIHVDARGLKWQRGATLSPGGELQVKLRTVPWDHTPYAERYPHLTALLQDDPGAPKYNILRRNLAIGSPLFHFIDGAQDWLSIDQSFDAKDARFIRDLLPTQRTAPADFALRPDSPAVLHGFQQMEFERIPR